MTIFVNSFLQIDSFLLYYFAPELLFNQISIMKNSIYLVLFLISFFSIHAYAEEQVPVKGEWENERIRSFIPERPVTYINNNNVLSIYLADALENLTIVITDSNGSIVYQDRLSFYGSGYTHAMNLNDQPDCYIIIISHRSEYLSGSFCI
jgi:hypothetical protein